MSFGAPSHRIESQLSSAAEILEADTEFVHLPNLVIVSVRVSGCRSTRTYFIKARGRVALTSLHRTHEVYRDVLHDRLTAQEGIDALKTLLSTPPLYSLISRCFLAFLSASTICALSFGGSLIDMGISGICAAVLQYLGLNAANRSSMYANVYEYAPPLSIARASAHHLCRVSISIIVAFVSRALGSLPGTPFCYSAISSAGVVLILPGFTICGCSKGSDLHRLSKFCSDKCVGADVSKLVLWVRENCVRDHLHPIPRECFSHPIPYTHETNVRVSVLLLALISTLSSINEPKEHIFVGSWPLPPISMFMDNFL